MTLPDVGGRKFIYALLITLLGFSAMLMSKVSAAEWKDLVVWCFAIFSAANVTESVSNTLASTKPQDKPGK